MLVSTVATVTAAAGTDADGEVRCRVLDIFHSSLTSGNVHRRRTGQNSRVNAIKHPHTDRAQALRSVRDTRLFPSSALRYKQSYMCVAMPAVCGLGDLM